MEVELSIKNEIKRTIEVLTESSLIEIRIVQQGATLSGYFKDDEKAINSIANHLGSGNTYIVMNEINDACYSREQRDTIIKAGKTTTDFDVTRRKWLLIDIDSKRPAGVGATDTEKMRSKEVGRKVFMFLRNIGFYEPVSADSGNGVHLLYSIDLENTAENTALIKKVLEVLDLYFTTSDAEIDKSVFNASRITKLYGTYARKGRNTKERPHRQSRLLKVPNVIKSTPIELLKKVADMMPQPDKPSYENNYGRDKFNLDKFIDDNGIKVKSIESYSGGRKYVLEHCVFDHSHKGKDACLFETSGGAIGYKCFHNSCSDYKWQDVRKHFDPQAYDRSRFFKDVRPLQNKSVKQLAPQDATQEKGKKFYQLHDIVNVDRSKLIYMKSHFNELDKKIIGFLKGEVSMWSGLNASGKSSVLSEIALNNINDGFKVAMYSGELTPNKVKNWMQLQAAGRQFTKPTEFENFYFVPQSIGEKIDSWVKDSFFLYNNSYGSEYNVLLAEIEELLRTKDIDVLILDNIMSMDLDDLATDNNSKQKKAILSISSIAKKYDVHIHIVAHPRKTNGLLRKKDISGSSDLSNAVDNVLIIHRVNNDFIREAKEYFGESDAPKYFFYDNVIEVCKNRDLGVQDYLVGLFFEIESKRLLNDRYENIVYGWQDIEEQQSIEYADEQTNITEVKNSYQEPIEVINVPEDMVDQFGNKECPF